MVNVALVVAPTGTVVVPAAPIVPPVQVNEDDTVRSPLWVPPNRVSTATFCLLKLTVPIPELMVRLPTLIVAGVAKVRVLTTVRLPGPL